MELPFFSLCSGSLRFPLMPCLLLAFCFDPSSVRAQVVDKVGLRQELDSLVLVFERVRNTDQFTISLSGVENLEGKVAESFGKMDSLYAACLLSHGEILSLNHNYDKSIPYFEESEKILQKSTGEMSLDYARALYRMGESCSKIGDKRVENCLIESKEIYEQLPGKNDSILSMVLESMADFYSSFDTKKADSLYLEKQYIEEAIAKENGKDDFNLLIEGFFLRWKTGKIEEAEHFILHIVRLYRAYNERTLPNLVDEDLLQWYNFMDIYSNSLFSFVAERPSDSLNIAAYETAAFYKNALLDVLQERKKRIANADSTQVTYNEWTRLKAQYAKMTTLFSTYDKDYDQGYVLSLSKKIDSLEKELIDRTSLFNITFEPTNWQKIRDALQPDHITIEFISYPCLSPELIGSSDEEGNPFDSIQYAALVLLPATDLSKGGRPGDKAPVFVPLCKQRELEAVIGVAPKSDRAEVWDTYIQRLYAGSQPGKASLYDLVWKPIEKALAPAFAQASAGKKTIFFSPDGLLHSLNLGAIPDPQGEYMGQRYQLVQLGSTRRLVQPASYQPADSSIALFGGIRYDMDSMKISAANAALPSIVATRGNYFASDSTLRGSIFDTLSAARTEVGNIAFRCQKRGFRVTIFTDYAATEEAVKTTGTSGNPSPRVLHIATHGLFFAEPNVETRGEAMLDGEQMIRLSDDPMRRSGLALAGAKYAWQTGKAYRPEAEDGILTAAEIKTMNLSNTELVVLSACETGLGHLAGNEGVYGLQRAFKIAGAKYLIMSLWSVPDGPTQQLMDLFYTNWLDKKMDIPAAFSAAQLAVKKYYPSPYYWGAFVLLQ